jgi:hypothetical protein
VRAVLFYVHPLLITRDGGKGAHMRIRGVVLKKRTPTSAIMTMAFEAGWPEKTY